MTEASSWSTLRGTLKRPGLHIQRIEDSMATGIPDTNLCYWGKEVWLEGKWVAALPKRLTTTVKVGLRVEQATWLEDRALAGGVCMVWIRITGRGWMLVRSDFRKLVHGFLWEDARPNGWSLHETSKELAEEILK